jgi:hypothetical protein
MDGPVNNLGLNFAHQAALGASVPNGFFANNRGSANFTGKTGMSCDFQHWIALRHRPIFRWLEGFATEANLVSEWSARGSRIAPKA